MAIQSSDPTNILRVQHARKARCTKLLGMNMLSTQCNHTGIVKTVMMADGSQIISVINGEITMTWMDERSQSETYNRIIEQN